jgi:hypothetical protein
VSRSFSRYLRHRKYGNNESMRGFSGLRDGVLSEYGRDCGCVVRQYVEQLRLDCITPWDNEGSHGERRGCVGLHRWSPH